MASVLLLFDLDLILEDILLTVYSLELTRLTSKDMFWRELHRVEAELQRIKIFYLCLFHQCPSDWFSSFPNFLFSRMWKITLWFTRSRKQKSFSEDLMRGLKKHTQAKNKSYEQLWSLARSLSFTSALVTSLSNLQSFLTGSLFINPPLRSTTSQASGGVVRQLARPVDHSTVCILR